MHMHIHICMCMTPPLWPGPDEQGRSRILRQPSEIAWGLKRFLRDIHSFSSI